MTQEDVLAAAWDGYRAALAQLEAAEQQVAQTDRDTMVGLLRRELNALGRREHEALRFVNERMSADINLAPDLFPDLMRRAGPTWRWVRNRRLLLRIAPSKLKALTAARAAAVMADQDGDYDYGDYWDLLDLMYHARWDDMMEPLIQAALESGDEDIYASGMDWKKTRGTRRHLTRTPVSRLFSDRVVICGVALP